MKTPHLSRPLLAMILFAAAPLASLADEKTDAAVKAAEQWLALVDAGDYAASWAEAAPFFKEQVAEDAWLTLVSAVRAPLGKAASRKLESSMFTTTLPGAPDGEYVVIQFKTDFANKPGSVETVTPMKDDKGVWRVSGYFVR
jgi:hypothetical protein